MLPCFLGCLLVTHLWRLVSGAYCLAGETGSACTLDVLKGTACTQVTITCNPANAATIITFIMILQLWWPTWSRTMC